MSQEEYVCNLPEEVREIAFKELRETDSIRQQSLDQMRDWINKNPSIKKCRTDAPFLLRFLRTKKFSFPQACEMLEKFVIIRQTYPQWFQKLDCEDKELAEIIDRGYIVALPERDEGKAVFLFCPSRYDPHKTSAALIIKALSLIADTYMDDEINQVCGYTSVNDNRGIQMAHISMFSITEFKVTIQLLQNCTPMRHKLNHFLNDSPATTKFLEFAKVFLSEKLKNRILVHDSLEELRSKIDPKILPKEYGGVTPLKEMIEKMKIKLKAHREATLSLDEIRIEIDEKRKAFLDEINEELGTGVSGSFKTLEVD